MVELKNGQYEFGDFVFGTRSRYAVPNKFLVGSFDVGQGDADYHDTTFPNEDGTKFGEDFIKGMLLTFQVNLWNKGNVAYDDLSVFKSVWKSREWRRYSNKAYPLRFRKGGRTRRVFGRPRRFKEQYGAIERGWAPIDCDFQCSDENFYDDEITEHYIGLANPPTSGLTAPVTAPITISQYANAYTNVNVLGDNPTWPTFTIFGPVVNPSLTFDNKWTLTLKATLAHDDQIFIDTHPWQRITVLNDSINKSNIYSSTSPIMRDMQFFPGLHDLVYSGLDPTLTSQVLVGWRNAWATP